MNKNLPAICAALFMCAILIVFLGSVYTKNDYSLADAASGKEIYLTFDDGPSDRVTPKILDVLKDEKVKATFFIIGKNALPRKNIIEREVAEGHAVGIHSYSHDYKEIYGSPENLLADIEKCNSVIKKITGKPSGIYRFPGGSFGLNRKFISAVCEKGLTYVDWNASFRDAEIANANPQQLFDAAINTPAYREKIVLLAHDATDKTATAEALKSVIGYYKNKNYVFKTF